MAIWRRPKLTARGDPDHDHVVAGIVARLLELPRRAVVLAEDETHLNLLPHVRASWTLRGARPQVLTPGTNRKVTVLGAIEVTTGAWVYRLGRRCAADFIALLDQVLQAFPRAPVIVVICDNDSIHHARKVTAYLEKHPRLELLYGARYSPHDNPAERIWAALKNYVANTAVSWPGRLRQIHSFFRNRSPDQMLATAAPWTSPWLPPGYEQNFWNAALAPHVTSRLDGWSRLVRNAYCLEVSQLCGLPGLSSRPSPRSRVITHPAISATTKRARKISNGHSVALAAQAARKATPAPLLMTLPTTACILSPRCACRSSTCWRTIAAESLSLPPHT